MALPHTSLGELAALPQTSYLDLSGPTSKRKGEGWEGKGLHLEAKKTKVGACGYGIITAAQTETSYVNSIIFIY